MQGSSEAKPSISSVIEGLQPIPTRLNNISQRTLKEYGDVLIHSIQIMKTPLNGKLEGSINLISAGQWEKIKKKNNMTNMFHLGLLLTLQNGQRIVIEKNEVVNVYVFKALKQGTVIAPVPLQGKQITLSQFIFNGIKYMGNDRFFDYKAFDGRNCQNFSIDLITGNNLMNQLIGNFTFQDLTGIKKDLNKMPFNAVERVVNGVTGLGSMFSRMIGAGYKGSVRIGLTKDEILMLPDDLPNIIKNKMFDFI